MIKHNITSAVLIMASIGILALPANAKEKRVVKARAICFERTAETPDIFISGPKEPYKILMPVEGFSMTFKCALDQGKAIFYKEDGVKPDGTPRRKIVAQTKVNGSMSKVLFYFVPNKEGTKRLYQVIAMEDGLKRFPLGHTRLLNLSDSEVVFQKKIVGLVDGARGGVLDRKESVARAAGLGLFEGGGEGRAADELYLRGLGREVLPGGDVAVGPLYALKGHAVCALDRLLGPVAFEQRFLLRFE